jgi:P27 family predicted phage terminase small subunit
MVETRNPPLTSSHHGTAYKMVPGTTQAPPVPTHLGPVGTGIWAFVWENAPVRISDTLAVERYCKMQEHRAALLKVVEEYGYTSTGSQGQAVVHPALRALSTLEGQMLMMEKTLGLTPEARARLNVDPDGGKDPLEEFFGQD